MPSKSGLNCRNSTRGHSPDATFSHLENYVVCGRRRMLRSQAQRTTRATPQAGDTTKTSDRSLAMNRGTMIAVLAVIGPASIAVAPSFAQDASGARMATEKAAPAQDAPGARMAI